MASMNARTADRMGRAWAQLLREMASEGVALPLGADIRIRTERGDLVVDAVVIAPPVIEADEPAPRGRKQ